MLDSSWCHYGHHLIQTPELRIASKALILDTMFAQDNDARMEPEIVTLEARFGVEAVTRTAAGPEKEHTKSMLRMRVS